MAFGIMPASVIRHCYRMLHSPVATGPAVKKPVFLIAFCAPLILNGTAWAEDASARWVHGSWVNVRENAQPDGKVLAQLVTNTQVSLLGQNQKSCEILWGETQRGFIPCRLLGNAPLRLADTALPDLPPDYIKNNPQYSPPRSFWIAPSMAALFDAGKHFQKTLLPAAQYAQETGETPQNTEKPAKLVRYPVPEFDAMKALLAQGIVAGPDNDPPLLSCRETRKLREKQPYVANSYAQLESPGWREKYPHASPYTDDCQHHQFPKLALPAIRPSLFRDARQIAPGSAGIERLGAHFGIVEKGRTIGAPKWEYYYQDGNHYTGAWDIGKYELKLEKPLVEHVIGRNGLVGAYRWQPSLRTTPFGPEESFCREGFGSKRSGKELLGSYPAVKDALLWFQATEPLPYTKATVSSRTLTPPPGKPAEEDRAYYKVVAYEIDLDNDKVPDFVLWDTWAAPVVSGPDPMVSSRRLFININGEWYPFDSDAYGECT